MNTPFVSWFYKNFQKNVQISFHFSNLSLNIRAADGFRFRISVGTVFGYGWRLVSDISEILGYPLGPFGYAWRLISDISEILGNRQP